MVIQNIVDYNGTDSYDQALERAIEASNKLDASSLKKVIIHEVDDDECSITKIPFKELLEKDLLFSTPCMHMFSLPDIISWLEKDATCPNCRKEQLTIEQLAQVVLLKKEVPSKNPKDEKVESPAASSQAQNPEQNQIEKPRFVPIIDGKPSDTISVEQALEPLRPRQTLRVLDTVTLNIRTVVKHVNGKHPPLI